jgi:hypothetical protein
MKETYEKACRDNGFEPGMMMLPQRDTVTNCFVAEDVDAAWDETATTCSTTQCRILRGTRATRFPANITHARTVEELRATSTWQVILSVDDATTRLRNGDVFNVSPLRGGIPPDIAWTYLRRLAELS